jgi:hypothetical protein
MPCCVVLEEIDSCISTVIILYCTLSIVMDFPIHPPTIYSCMAGQPCSRRLVLLLSLRSARHAKAGITGRDLCLPTHIRQRVRGGKEQHCVLPLRHHCTLFPCLHSQPTAAPKRPATTRAYPTSTSTSTTPSLVGSASDLPWPRPRFDAIVLYSPLPYIYRTP